MSNAPAKTLKIARPAKKGNKRAFNFYLAPEVVVPAAQVLASRYQLSASAAVEEFLKRELESKQGFLRACVANGRPRTKAAA